MKDVEIHIDLGQFLQRQRSDPQRILRPSQAVNAASPGDRVARNRVAGLGIDLDHGARLAFAGARLAA